MADMASLLRQCDQRAGLTHSWKEFTPTGLLIYTNGTVQAVHTIGGTTVTEACTATGRAARRDFKTIAAIGVICAAWASKTSIGNPAQAQDRIRARITYAVDREHLVHIFTNMAGQQNYETDLSPIAGIGRLLCQVIAEATFSSWDFCPTGTHMRKSLL